MIVGGGNQVKPASEELPPGFVTVTLPVAPFPTIAVMLVEELTVNERAFIPPILTPVAPVKDVPEIFSTVPKVPFSGVKEVTVGNEMYPVNEPVPPTVVTLTDPDPPDGVMAVIVVGDTTIKEVAGTLAKLTAVTPEKFVPVIVTVTPAAADVGLKLVTVGGGI